MGRRGEGGLGGSGGGFRWEEGEGLGGRSKAGRLSGRSLVGGLRWEVLGGEEGGGGEGLGGRSKVGRLGGGGKGRVFGQVLGGRRGEGG